LAFLGAFNGGCAHWPATPQLKQADGPDTVSTSDPLRPVRRPVGGPRHLRRRTRAAALGYGVLEELRRTEVTVNGVRRRLLDEWT